MNHCSRKRLGLGATLWLALQIVIIPGDCSLAVADPADDGGVARVLTEVLATQSAAWNRADIDGFMEHYWKSEQLTFSAGGTTTRGWQATITRYKKRYSSPDKMGRLTFDHLEFTPLGETSALVLGQWHLQRREDKLGGNFSLVFRRVNERWVIIHDHTSSFEPPKD